MKYFRVSTFLLILSLLTSLTLSHAALPAETYLAPTIPLGSLFFQVNEILIDVSQISDTIKWEYIEQVENGSIIELEVLQELDGVDIQADEFNFSDYFTLSVDNASQINGRVDYPSISMVTTSGSSTRSTNAGLIYPFKYILSDGNDSNFVQKFEEDADKSGLPLNVEETTTEISIAFSISSISFAVTMFKDTFITKEYRYSDSSYTLDISLISEEDIFSSTTSTSQAITNISSTSTTDPVSTSSSTSSNDLVFNGLFLAITSAILLRLPRWKTKK